MNEFKINGIEALQKAILETYSSAKATKIRKEALNAGGDLVAERLKKNFETFKDTGHSKEEITRTDAKTKNDIETVKIGWNGPHNRWRLIHINEFGYTKMGKQYTPKGLGVIEKTVNETENEYFTEVAKKMRGKL